MRIKFLSLIVSFLFVSIAISSCLDSDDNYELSSDATVHAFGIDTIHGKYYKFSIDQLNRLIYNVDSLPVGSDTIIDRILIDSMLVTGWITSGTADTLFQTKDSVNLLPAMNKSGNDGMKFKVHAADQVTVREYTLQIRVHLQHPDSLVWKDMKTEGNVFSSSVITASQRSVILKNDLLVYTSNTTVYKTPTEVNKYNWTQEVTKLPSDAKLQSIINFQEKLYITTNSGDVYSSDNGTVWEKSNGLSTQIVALVTCLPKNEITNQPATLVGILKDTDGKNYYCTTSDGLLWSKADAAQQDFPTENIYSAVLHTANGVDKAVVVGMPQSASKQTVPWFSMDGRNWGSLSTPSDTFCPGMNNPSIIYYGDMFYCFGGKMDVIYSSVDALAWFKTTKMFLLPEAFKDKGNYSMTVDKNNFIWIVFGGGGTPNEVWRGRLNRLGFKQQ